MKIKSQRQGDVCAVKMETMQALPKSATIVKHDGNRIVLAYGEVTGHAHAIYENLDSVKLWADGKIRYLEVMAKAMTTDESGNAVPGVTLKHEEHTHHVIAPGIYKLPVQVEYTPQALRRTAD